MNEMQLKRQLEKVSGQKILHFDRVTPKKKAKLQKALKKYNTMIKRAPNTPGEVGEREEARMEFTEQILKINAATVGRPPKVGPVELHLSFT